MAGMFDMMKKASSMQKQMKQIQKELVSKTAEGKSGVVTVVVRGDMSIKSVTVDGAMDTMDVRKVEKMFLVATNSALDSVKKMAGGEMTKMTGGLGGLTDMLKG